MPYTVIDLDQDLDPWRLNLNNDVLFQAQSEDTPGQMRLVSGEIINLPPEVGYVYGVSDNGLVLGALKTTGSGWCDIATGLIEPIVLAGQPPFYGQAINNQGDVAGWVGEQAFIINRATRAITLVPPSLPSPLAGSTNTNVLFNDINDLGQAVGVQQWFDGTNQLEVPVWFNNGVLAPIGEPTFIANGILIANDQTMRVWYNGREDDGQDYIFDANTGALTAFEGFILDLRSGGRVLWTVETGIGPTYLTTPYGTASMIELFPPGSGYVSAYGQQINEAGTIIGTAGKDDGMEHAFMLVPDLAPPRFHPPIAGVLIPTIIIEEAGGIVETLFGDAPGAPEVFHQGEGQGEDGDGER
jgi:hypothetical protein